MANTTLSNARAEVEGRRIFKVANRNTSNGSVYSEARENLYIVYSYGYHFPMWVYDYSIGKWIGNEDKYSVTTSKQQGKTRPNNVSYWLNTDSLRHLIGKGGFVEYKLREVV
jgi:hypothetical protein